MTSNTTARLQQSPTCAEKDLPRRRTAGGTAYHEAGAGEVLVFVHGVGMRLDAWLPQIACFSATHRVIAVDMPGHGDSERIAAGTPLEGFVDWFTGFLDDLHLSEVNIAGHSMGALICGGAAATLGSRISRLAYLNGVYRRDPAAKASVLARAAAIPAIGIDKEGPLQRWFGAASTDIAARASTKRWLELMNPEAYATAYAAFAGGDATYAHRWPDVLCPSLFLTGELDPNSTPAMAHEMAKITPFGWAEVVEGHRHMVNLTAPDVVNNLLTAWLRRPQVQP